MKEVTVGEWTYPSLKEAIRDQLLESKGKVAFVKIAQKIGCRLPQVSQVYTAMVVDGEIEDTYKSPRGYRRKSQVKA